MGGSGPALVLVGGTLMPRARHTPLALALSQDFTVHNYDRGGRGDSGDHPRYDVRREIDDLDALIEHVGGPVLRLTVGLAMTLPGQTHDGGCAPPPAPVSAR
ncbi:alpha/beta fold hydrolase [Streptomyces sp. NPDC004285]